MQMTYCKCCLRQLCGEIPSHRGALILKLPVLMDDGQINYAHLSIDAEQLARLFNESGNLVDLATHATVLLLDTAHQQQHQSQHFAAIPVQ